LLLAKSLVSGGVDRVELFTGRFDHARLSAPKDALFLVVEQPARRDFFEHALVSLGARYLLLGATDGQAKRSLKLATRREVELVLFYLGLALREVAGHAWRVLGKGGDRPGDLPGDLVGRPQHLVDRLDRVVCLVASGEGLVGRPEQVIGDAQEVALVCGICRPVNGLVG